MDGITDSMDMSLSKLWEMVKDGSLVCCSPWGHRELDMPERLKNKMLKISSTYSVYLADGQESPV